MHRAAFPTAAEARLVDALRERGELAISLVAEEAGEVVGHIAFSAVRVDERPTSSGLGLAPVAVLPGSQGRGVGASLVRAGLAAAGEKGWGWVVVLGDPAYYARFGFGPASVYGLSDSYEGGDAFQVLELAPGRLPREGGRVRYASAFDALDEPDHG